MEEAWPTTMLGEILVGGRFIVSHMAASRQVNYYRQPASRVSERFPRVFCGPFQV